MYKRTRQSLKKMHPKLKNHFGRSRKFGDGEKLKWKKKTKQYLVLWRGFPVEEATWITQNQFIRPELLQQFIQDDKPTEEKVE